MRGMETLLQARRRARVSVQDAAGHVGVHFTTVYRWESGKADIPAWAFVALMRLYKADPWDIDLTKRTSSPPT